MIQSYHEFITNATTAIPKHTIINLYHSICDEQWTIVCTLLSRFTLLQHLDLSCCSLKDEHIMNLLNHSTMGNHIQLTHLILSGNSISDNGAIHISVYLQSNQILQELHLRFNNIGSKGVASLAKALSLHRSIHTLDLSFNKFSTNGVKALCYAMMLNHSLETLSIAGNSLNVCYCVLFLVVTIIFEDINRKILLLFIE
jgi:Ran GTPase-activating protein (RanGAP) involved in mRNA processing and transport